jgi:hypothetical protein
VAAAAPSTMAVIVAMVVIMPVIMPVIMIALAKLG